ncbi:MAG: BTAD domain-containing putative transcriptional regulator, partial [Armatimonadota bacterium]|nr:BTAD domain-containing putative transcriptional regulator [Armatimonadota bacterium]
EICVRLDGVPLAIELAAARIPILSPQQIAARLGDRFRLLTGSSRSWPERHRTLQAVIDWSYNLLSEEERAVLRRLGVFAGAFTLEAAAQVAVGPPVREDRILDLVAVLVDHSLLVVEPGRPAPYRLLETIRQYAQARLLESGEAEAVRDRHLACYLGIAEWGAHGLEGPRDRAPVQAVAAQHDNIRAAMEWAQARGDVIRGLRLAVAAAGPMWAGHIHSTEARQWLEGWLQRGDAREVGQPIPETLRARALYWAGELAWEVGDNRRAQQALEESSALFRRLGDGRGLASALNTLAVVWYRTAAYAAARRALEESVSIGRALADPGLTAFALLIQGIVARLEGDYERAEAWGRESLEVARAADLTRAVALALDSLGVLAAQRGDGDAAESLAQEAVAHFRSLGDAYGTAASLNTLALAALARGDTALARARSLESLPISRRLAARGSAGRSQLTLARAALREGDTASALTAAREALDLFQKVGERLGLVQSLEVLGAVALQAGGVAGARLLGAAAAARARLGAPQSPLEQDHLARPVRAAEAAAAPGALQAARAAGEGMTLDAAIEEARALARSLVLPAAAPFGPQLRVRLLGGFEVWRGEERLSPKVWRRRRDRLLFTYLLVAREPVPREALLEALWPHLPPESAQASLGVAWSNAKRALDSGGPGDACLVLERGRYGIRRGAVVTDVQEFDAHVAAAARARDVQAALRALETAAGIYRGDLLPDEANEPWTTLERERLRTAYIGVLERLAEARASQGQVAEAEAHLREILRLDPWREEVYRRLMVLLAEHGRRAEALRLYQECVAALRRELEVGPSGETVALAEAIARGERPGRPRPHQPPSR